MPLGGGGVKAGTLFCQTCYEEDFPRLEQRSGNSEEVPTGRGKGSRKKNYFFNGPTT